MSSKNSILGNSITTIPILGNSNINSIQGNHYVNPITSSGIETRIVDPKIDALVADVKLIKQRLMIIEPDIAKIDKFQALKEAYNNYIMIEELCRNG